MIVNYLWKRADQRIKKLKGQNEAADVIWVERVLEIGPDERKPWYLLTTEPIHTPEPAWHIIFAYARCWRIEVSLRFPKSEMDFESPRLLKWESRMKFLLSASLSVWSRTLATEPESGAEISRLHIIACAWLCLVSGLSLTLPPSLP